MLYSFSCLFSPHFGCGKLYSIVQHCKGDCFTPSLEHPNVTFTYKLSEKKPKLGFYRQKQPGITPFQAHNFCTIARDGDREKPKPFSQLQFTQHNTAASQPALYWLKKRDVAGLCLDATSAQHRGVFSPPIPKFPLYFPASLMQLWVPHSGQLWSHPEGPQNTTAENTSQFSKAK